MYYSRERSLHENINNASLVFCTRIAQKVKEPPYIPFLEVYTYGLISRFFELSESRIKNAYNSNRYLFEDDCTMISGRDIAMYATDQKNLGKHYGYLCGFPNGIMAEVSYTTNIVFNSRALLHFAVLLEKESDVASDIAKMIDTGDYQKHGYLRHNTPWFFAEQERVHETSMCPFVSAQMKTDNHAVDAPPVKLESKANKNTKKCARVDSLGRVIKVFDSAADAARYYGIRGKNIYNVLNGRAQTVNSPSGDATYRFRYINE